MFTAITWYLWEKTDSVCFVTIFSILMAAACDVSFVLLLIRL
jgi:hypothetical protein